MKHMRHTPVTVEQYLRDLLAKARRQIPVHFWSTDPTNHCNRSNGSYMHMEMNHETFMKQQ